MDIVVKKELKATEVEEVIEKLEYIKNYIPFTEHKSLDETVKALKAKVVCLNGGEGKEALADGSLIMMKCKTRGHISYHRKSSGNWDCLACEILSNCMTKEPIS